MRLLASDYDGTLNSFDYDLKLNLPSIKKFIDSGNIFILNTGRNYASIKKEISKHNIPYNYVSCNDGNLLLDRNEKIIYSTNIKEYITILIKDLLEIWKSIDLRICKYKDNTLEYILTDNAFSDRFIGELSRICHAFGLKYSVYKEFGISSIYIQDKNVNKSTPVKIISDIEKIEKCDIFTIGDNLNDLEMIRDFNGYTLPWGKKELKNVANGVCLSVSSLVKKITR